MARESARGNVVVHGCERPSGLLETERYSESDSEENHGKNGSKFGQKLLKTPLDILLYCILLANIDQKYISRTSTVPFWLGKVLGIPCAGLPSSELYYWSTLACKSEFRYDRNAVKCKLAATRTAIHHHWSQIAFF